MTPAGTAPARAPRTVRVRTEVAALTKTLDYTVPPKWVQDVRIGTRVRVPLHGRTVRGWVVDDALGDDAADGVDVLPLKSWLGWGPPPAVVDLAEWAAWRWAGAASFFLRTASPDAIVRALPTPPTLEALSDATSRSEEGTRPFWYDAVGGVAGVAGVAGPTMVRLAPTVDQLDLVVSAVTDGPIRSRGGCVVVLVPSLGWAERLVARLVRRGVPATTAWDEARAGWPVVVGSRAAAWAPVQRLAAAVVLDAHDDAYREESTPTYNAVEVLMERARREGAPCVLVSPVPPVWAVGSGELRTVAAPPVEERAGWPALERVDRRGADPRTGLFSDEFVRLARLVLADAGTGAGAGGEDDVTRVRGPLVCVYNRTGGARVLACHHCGELARCERCGAAEARPRGQEVLRCPRCGEERPVVCEHCGRLKFKTLRAGVSRVREELAALLEVPVGEVAGPSGRRGEADEVPPAPVLVGTEAVLHRVRHAAAVAFLDIDLHLLAPRLTATEDTLALMVRAGRLVGARRTGPAWARVLVQTRVPEHPVLAAVALGDTAPVLAAEADIRRVSGLPPFSAVALVSGALGESYAAALTDALTALGGPRQSAVTVSPLDDGRFLVQAAEHQSLCDLLAATARPPGRGLRVEVDPPTI